MNTAYLALCQPFARSIAVYILEAARDDYRRQSGENMDAPYSCRAFRGIDGGILGHFG
jgi:hypothetical protein